MKAKFITILLLTLAGYMSRAQDFNHPNQLIYNPQGPVSAFQGFYTKISANGNCIIATSVRKESSSDNSKLVLNVFSFNGTNFSSFSNNLFVTTISDITASMADISNDCKTISISSPYGQDLQSQLLVYTFNGAAFSQVNNTIIYGTLHLAAGSDLASTAISGDGKIIIAGNYRSTVNGVLWVYSFDGIGYQNVQTITSSFYRFAEGGVDISSDGNTIAVGSDFQSIGQTSVYKLSSGTYNLVTTIQPTNYLNNYVAFGGRVALSNNGNILAVAGWGDSLNVGAVWCYTFNGSNYVLLGNKIMGSNVVGKSYFGESLALSDDGTTIVVGGPNDDPGKQHPTLGYIDGLGASWVYSLSGTGFQQVGNKITPPAPTATMLGFGYSVSVSSDGSKVIIGAPFANVTTNGTNTYYQGGIYVYGPTITGINQPINTIPGTGNPNTTTGTTTTVGGNTLNIDDYKIMDEIIVAPNPNQGLLQIINKSGLSSNFIIMNLTGEILYENKLRAVQNAYQIYIPEGLYLIKFDSGLIQKLIVEK